MDHKRAPTTPSPGTSHPPAPPDGVITRANTYSAPGLKDMLRGHPSMPSCRFAAADGGPNAALTSLEQHAMQSHSITHFNGGTTFVSVVAPEAFNQRPAPHTQSNELPLTPLASPLPTCRNIRVVTRHRQVSGHGVSGHDSAYNLSASHYSVAGPSASLALTPARVSERSSSSGEGIHFVSASRFSQMPLPQVLGPSQSIVMPNADNLNLSCTSMRRSDTVERCADEDLAPSITLQMAVLPEQSEGGAGRSLHDSVESSGHGTACSVQSKSPVSDDAKGEHTVVMGPLPDAHRQGQSSGNQDVASIALSTPRSSATTSAQKNATTTLAVQPSAVTPPEMANLDYTPCTEIRPVDFSGVLRPTHMNRRIRLCITVTVYNESGDELRRTLLGIAQNLPGLQAAGLHWSEVLIIAVFDGRCSASPSMLAYAEEELAMYMPHVLASEVDGKPVTCHVFQRTIQLSQWSSQKTHHLPLQLMLAVKEKNAGKLNSHLWFFSGFCNQLDPKYCLLLDVGTIPRPKALARMYEALEEDPHIGGACGEIAVRNVSVWSMLQSAQAFEYTVAHVLDKSLESTMGFVPVLPGAFSAYRWAAIKGEPLGAYFALEETSAKDLSPFVANMFLAEDRILCFEIVAQQDRQWLLRYVPNCVAETDAPESLVELIKQRRRWLNGSFFASVRYMLHVGRFLRTNHSMPRKLMFGVQWLFTAINTVLAWLSVSTLFLSLLMVFNQVIDNLAPVLASTLTSVFLMAYLALLFVQVVLGLTGVNPSRVEGVYLSIAVLYGALMLGSVASGLWLMVRMEADFLIILSACSTFGAYLVAGALHGRLAKIALSMIQYVTLIPFFVTVLATYSVCNIQDCSWGTRPGSITSLLQQEHTRNADASARKAANLRAGAAGEGLAHTGATAAATAAGPPDSRLQLHGRGTSSTSAANSVTDGTSTRMTVQQANGKSIGGAVVLTLGGEGAGTRSSSHLDLKSQHDKEAARQRALGEQLAADKNEQAIEFNLFRVRMVLTWFLSNVVVVLIVSSYDPGLEWLALTVAGSIVFQTGTKLIGSAAFQGVRVLRACMRGSCGCCYRIQRVPGRPAGNVRAVCCCGSFARYDIDDEWEAGPEQGGESGVRHVYPDWEMGPRQGQAKKRGTREGAPPSSRNGRDARIALGLGPCARCVTKLDEERDTRRVAKQELPCLPSADQSTATAVVAGALVLERSTGK